MYCFDKIEKLEIPTTKVDQLPIGDLIGKFAKVINTIKPTTVLMPYINDVHTDHYFVTKAVLSCCKWFRYPSIRNVLYYETISETDFNINTADKKINLNVYVDISKYYDKKIEAIKIYSSELSDFPFPRSLKSIDALASLRGSQCGAEKAEAFELLRGVIC
ncbi:hypothetical protein AGMMS50230_22060 [Spirochaetia bacterium]|nr:hypothetical protein AGMMS50230_22060 [Spirochaetia bacterium]